VEEIPRKEVGINIAVPATAPAWFHQHKFTLSGSCHMRQKAQAPVRNRQTRKVANAKVLNRNTYLT